MRQREKDLNFQWDIHETGEETGSYQRPEAAVYQGASHIRSVPTVDPHEATTRHLINNTAKTRLKRAFFSGNAKEINSNLTFAQYFSMKRFRKSCQNSKESDI